MADEHEKTVLKGKSTLAADESVEELIGQETHEILGLCMVSFSYCPT